MGPKDGMTHWTITSGGSSSTELVRFSADGAIACVFLHIRALGLVMHQFFLNSMLLYVNLPPDVISHFGSILLADHPKASEYYSDPRLAAYAVPYAPILSW